MENSSLLEGVNLVIDLVDLKGKELLKDYKVKTLVEFEGE